MGRERLFEAFCAAGGEQLLDAGDELGLRCLKKPVTVALARLSESDREFAAPIEASLAKQAAP